MKGSVLLLKREEFELSGTFNVGSPCATGSETSVLNLGSPEVQRNEGEQRTHGPRLGIMQCRGPNRRTLPLLGILAHGAWAGELFPLRALAEGEEPGSNILQVAQRGWVPSWFPVSATKGP